MTNKDKSTVERALGLIEGLSYGVESHISNGLVTAVEMIEEVINKEEVDDEKKKS